MKRVLSFLTAAIIIISFVSCEDSDNDPNKIGGETDIELNKVGNEFGVSFSMPGEYQYILNNVKDSVFITKSENGIVTIDAKFAIDEESLKKIDTLLGTQDFTEETKRSLVDTYLEKYNATIDTSDKQNMSLSFQIKSKITSEGIQGFTHSNGDESRPFTLIKYNAKVGDKYTFTADDGTVYTREVVSKSTDDDYELGFIYIKVFKIEEL
jgi:hypothetical protein